MITALSLLNFLKSVFRNGIARQFDPTCRYGLFDQTLDFPCGSTRDIQYGQLWSSSKTHIITIPIWRLGKVSSPLTLPLQIRVKRCNPGSTFHDHNGNSQLFRHTGRNTVHYFLTRWRFSFASHKVRLSACLVFSLLLILLPASRQGTGDHLKPLQRHRLFSLIGTKNIYHYSYRSGDPR